MSARAQSAPALHIVGPNPSMDRTQIIERLAVGEVNRAVRSEPMAGGKGLIVARALARLGTPSSLYGFVGGVVGDYIRAECSRLGVDDQHTAIGEETRINSVILDRSSGAVTVINEPGPRVRGDDVEALFSALLPRIAPGDLVALSGSLPREVDASFAARLVSEARSRGARMIVDTSGEPLRSSAAARPWAVKCNLEEFRFLRPDAPSSVDGERDRAALTTQARGLVGAGTEVAIVTLGAAGAVAVTESEAVWARPPRIDVVNATGSGDTFLAGILHALAQGERLAAAVALAVAASATNALRTLPDLGEDPSLDAMLHGVELRTENTGAGRGVAP